MDTILAYAGLAATYRCLGRVDETNALNESQLELARRIFGERHTVTMTCLSQLCDKQRHRGALERSPMLDKEALRLHRKSLGEENRLTA